MLVGFRKVESEIIRTSKNAFKDEVRKVGNELAIPSDLVNRHPFPGPGLLLG